MKTRSRSVHHTRIARLWAVGAFFALVCLVYAGRLAMLELNRDNIRGHRQDGTVSRTVIVQAVRGQIYDRNGVPLVRNHYTYSLTLDDSVLPSDPTERNRVILKALKILEECGEVGRFSTNHFPFDGYYPDYTYAPSALDPASPTGETLKAVFHRNGLEREAVQRIRGDRHLNKTEALSVYEENPAQAVSCERLIAYFEKEYRLTDGTYDNGQLFSYADIDRLFRIVFGMEATGFSRANDYILAEDVRMDTITHEKEQGLPGIGFQTRAERVYTYPGYASHILGETGPIYREEWPYYKELGYHMNAVVGKSGCEAAFEAYLHGQDGVKVIVEDRDGHIVDEYMKTEPVAGKDVYLTIDIRLQKAAEDGLAENVRYIRHTYGRTECRAGALVAMDPGNGEILALASYPSYNLATFHENYAELSQNKGLPLFNRALQGLYAPGSTFKPGMVAAAMNEGVIRPDTLLECTGKYTYYKSYQPECWIYRSSSSDTHRHGFINAAEALRVSCNCFFYETGRLLGIDRMNTYGKLFGLGEPTGIELNEKTGILAGPAARESAHGMAWQPTDTIAAAIGQSDNAFTPLQLTVYLSSLTNGGTRYAAHLLSRVRDISTHTDLFVTEPHIEESFPLSEQSRAEVIRGMEAMVATSYEVRRHMKQVPVTVAGKTGTAQIGAKSTENGLFVCCAPSQHPDIVVTSVIERAGGGSYSAMAAGRVLEAFYRLPEQP